MGAVGCHHFSLGIRLYQGRHFQGDIEVTLFNFAFKVYRITNISYLYKCILSITIYKKRITAFKCLITSNRNYIPDSNDVALVDTKNSDRITRYRSCISHLLESRHISESMLIRTPA